MKKIFVILTLGIFLLTGLVVLKPNLNSASSKSPTKTLKTVSKKISTSNVKTFTLAQLKKYDGQNGNPAYVAVDGVVYDVTAAWGGGFHNGVTAGADVSKDITRSPHGKSVLKKLPIVGKLAK